MEFGKRAVLASVAAVMAIAPLARANDVIFGVAGSPTNSQDGGKVVGFSANSMGETIAALGFFDYQQDGIAGTYQLGIWDSSQNLIGTATVTPSSPLIGNFRWANLASPVTIGTNVTPDTFTIGALLPTTMPDVWWENGVVLLLGAGYTGAAIGQYADPALTLTYPGTLTSPEHSYYVVNGRSEAVNVPEPATLGLLGAGALLILR